MGYTHYWTVKRPFTTKQWAIICADTRALFEKSVIVLVGDEEDQQSEPIADSKQIRFNGAGDGMYETFLLSKGIDDAFCKTARMPYDLIVCAVLIVANKHAPKSITITSDGGMASFVDDYPGPHDSEWDAALAFVRQVLGADYKLPRFIECRK